MDMEKIEGLKTSVLRSMAWDKMNDGQYEIAAELYEQAIKHYPNHHIGSSISIDDKKNLMKMVLFCRSQLKVVA